MMQPGKTPHVVHGHNGVSQAQLQTQNRSTGPSLEMHKLGSGAEEAYQ